MYAVYDRTFGDFLAKNTVCTPYIYGSGKPYLYCQLTCSVEPRRVRNPVCTILTLLLCDIHIPILWSPVAYATLFCGTLVLPSDLWSPVAYITCFVACIQLSCGI